MRNALIIISLIHLGLSVHAQKFTISGYIRDSETGESLIGATALGIKTFSGTSANTHGFYSLTLSKDSIVLVFSYVGYQPATLKFLLRKDTVVNVGLKNSAQLDEVVIKATESDAIHESTKMSTVTISAQQIKSMPAFMGETDILKVLQLTPGVQSGNEGSTGLYVRGGGPDQNLILLDGVPVYNASHLFGFFSTFNADAINHVELIKGGFPARYGGRLSSVIDINMKDGDMKKFKGEGTISLIAAKATLEGPIIKDKTSFIISFRRTYLDALAQPIIHSIPNNKWRGGYYFYDLNFKVNHIINPRNRLYFSSYFGNDKAHAKTKESSVYDTISVSSKQNDELKWGNSINAFRWNHIYGPKLFSNLTATYSRYNFELSHEREQKQSSPNVPDEIFYNGGLYHSGIRDWAAKIDFDYIPNPNHFIRFGVNNIWHTFSPGVYNYKITGQEDVTGGATATKAYEGSVYLEDDWKISNRLKFNVGAHASTFAVENKWYHSLQPRLSSRFLITDDLALKASVSSMTQYIHLLTNSGIGLPTDLWVPSTASIKPQQAKQVGLGIAKTYNSKYEFSLEGYYKKMDGLIEYKDGASFLNVDQNWQDNVVSGGHGKSYGMEVFLQKKTGAITGWLGYTLSKTTRQFDELNFGKVYPYKYDRRHDISLVLSYAWNKHMDFSMTWVYGSGNSITLPLATLQGSSINPRDASTLVGTYSARSYYYYGDRNSYRMNSYQRMDISFSWWKDKKWGQRKWTLAVYNLYNYKNPFYVGLVSDSQNQRVKFIQYSLFPIIPSISYSFVIK
ncbi:MAG TPA: TonB-dependent receptor plug domain-containing protein [Cyclobacteriaceae bacterium]|jgi:outer membrane cobalamin receptor|nr:TonB-dependent receptor plug domain-containing protein [Cyclobacteriaceae bacterium]